MSQPRPINQPHGARSPSPDATEASTQILDSDDSWGEIVGNDLAAAGRRDSSSSQGGSNRSDDNAGRVARASSLIFPTEDETVDNESVFKRHKIDILLDQCERVRFPFNKKKLVLENLDLSAADLPVKDLSGTTLGNTLHKLSLSGNRLSSIPERLVQCLPVLKTLDLSQCDLVKLPSQWNLPQLKRLNLSQNRLEDFPEEVSFPVFCNRFCTLPLLTLWLTFRACSQVSQSCMNLTCMGTRLL